MLGWLRVPDARGTQGSRTYILPSFRGAPLRASPESMSLRYVLHDSGLALPAPRNDDGRRRPSAPLTRAAGAGPAFPAIEHLAEFSGGRESDLVRVGGRGGEPIRLRVLTPAASLRPPFAGNEIARDITTRKTDPEQYDQHDSGLHNQLRLFQPQLLTASAARSMLDTGPNGRRAIFMHTKFSREGLERFRFSVLTQFAHNRDEFGT